MENEVVVVFVVLYISDRLQHKSGEVLSFEHVARVPKRCLTVASLD